MANSELGRRGRSSRLSPRPARPGSLALLLTLGGLSALGPTALDINLPGLPSMARDFGVSASASQLTIAVFLVGLGTGQLLSGALSDAFGRRRPMLVALLGYVVSSAACGLAPSIELLLVVRLFEGATAAAGIAISRAVVRDIFDGPAGVRFLSRLVLIYGTAPLLAPLVGGQVMRFTDWRGTFAVLVLLGVVLLLASWFWLPETHPTAGRGGVRAPGPPFRQTFRVLLRDRSFLACAIVLGAGNAAVIGYVAASPFVFQNVYGLSPQAYGVIYGICAAALIAGSQLSAHLAGRYGTRTMLVAALSGGVASGVGFLTLSLLDVGPWPIAGCVALLLWSWGFIPANAIALGMAEHPATAGTASALLGLFQYGMSGLTSPLSGIGGGDSALPTGILIAALMSFALLSILTLTSARALIPEAARLSPTAVVPPGDLL